MTNWRPPTATWSAKPVSARPWPTSWKRLKSIVERALIESQGQDIGLEHLHLAPASPTSAAAPTLEEAIGAMPLNFREAELALIERAVKKTDGNIAAASRLLGVERTKVYRRLKDAGRLKR
jgi:DNA-binding NtrC family response regulator